MNIRRALAAAAVFLIAVTSAIGQVRIGDRIEDVYQELGSPDSHGRLGQTETMQYKDGTKITLRNGVVTEISVRGQMTIGNVTKVVELPKLPVQPTANQGRAVASSAPAAPVKKSEPATPPLASKKVKTPPPAETTAATNLVSAARTTASTKASPATVALSPKGVAGIIQRIKAIIAGFVLVFVVMSAVMYGFTCFCLKLICEKAGKPGGALVWIPIVQIIPLLRIAEMREWMLALLFIPVVNIGFMFMLWSKICVARGKNPWLAASLVVPLGGFALIAYLAFSGANELAEETPVTNTPPEVTGASAPAEASPAEPASQETASEVPFAEMPDPTADSPAVEQPSAA